MATVPDVAGVPVLAQGAAIIQQALTLLQYDTFAYFNASARPVWGIYLNGAAVITPDTITGFSWRKSWVIADYHVERGGFESYDKVETPHETNIRFAAGGDVPNRERLLRILGQIAPNLTLYDIVTPEITYVNCNIQHLDYDRQPRRGNGLLQVDVSFLEIRVNVSEAGAGISIDNAAVPSGASPINGGTVQTTTLSPAEQLAAGEIPI